jgi:hypothetical protein
VAEVSGVTEAILALVGEGRPVAMTYREYWQGGGRALMAGYRDSALRFGATMAKGRAVAAEIDRLDALLLPDIDDLPL